jgi:hypothetical protein
MTDMLSEHQFILLLYGDKCDEITSANSAKLSEYNRSRKVFYREALLNLR